MLESGFARTSIAADAATAKKRYGLEQHDIVIISALQGASGVRLACEVTKLGYAGVLLLVKNEQYEGGVKARQAGRASCFCRSPLEPDAFFAVLRLLAAMRERMRGIEDRARTLETKMNELKMVERAKWVLVEYLKMSEAEAHRYIEKAGDGQTNDPW